MLARLVLVTMLLAATGICTADDKKKEDKDLIQGEWVVMDSTIPEQIGKKLIVKRDEWTSPTGQKFTLMIDPSKKPKQLDLTRAEDNTKFQGIYKLADDKLTFCRAKVAQFARPTEFKATQRNDLLILKREKSSPTTLPSKPPTP